MVTVPRKSLDNGFSMPVYGMGTWQVGGRFERNPENDDAADVAAIRKALDLGITHFDTAELYAGTHAEQLLGEALSGADRSSLFLVSKASPKNHRPDDLRRSFEASCERMGTDYLDLYMLHRYNSSVPLDETMDALCSLVDEGRLIHPAISNFSVKRMIEAQSVSRHKIVANQLHYNLQVREVEYEGLLDHCQKNDVMLIAWGPVQKGALHFNASILVDVAKKYDRTPAQIAINWLTSQRSVVTLSKTRSIAHMQENLGALDFTMDDADIELLRKEMPGQLKRSDRLPLDYS